MAAALLAVALGGCAARTDKPLELANPPAGARIVPVFVATNRTADPASPITFTAGRARELSYARYDVSIPPTHKPGEVEAPDGRDPAKSFAVVKAQRLDEAAFFREVRGVAKTARTGATGVFVHGYNYTFEEALFRRAQLAADAHVAGAPVMFSWPSAASPTAYVADRDASTLSRDAFAHVLERLTEEKARKVIVFSHSMGSSVTMEALRDLRLSGRGEVVDRLDQVVMAAPDIDIDLFVEQLQTVGRLKGPLVVLVSKEDGALSFSSALAGGRRRVGNVDVDDARVQTGAKRYDVSVIDVTEVKDAGGLGHDRYAALAALYPKLRRQLDAHSSVASKAGAFVFNLAAGQIAPTRAAQPAH